MAVNATAAWRVRPSGSNTNGGGYDCGSPSGGSITPAATGTAGSWTTTSGTTTFVDTTSNSGSSFSSGMVGASINIGGLRLLITGYNSATSITINTPRTLNSINGSNNNWIVGPSGSQDYSQQDSAQASGTHGTAAGTTAFSDTTANNFTSAMVGNALYLTGTGLTTGWYFCTAFTDSSHITIDRSPGTGSTGTWHLGGAWADFWTNAGVSGSNVVAGNIVYVLGGASPSRASPDYTHSTADFNPANGSSSGLIRFLGDPATPSSNGFSGLPVVKSNFARFFRDPASNIIGYMFFVAGTTTAIVYTSGNYLNTIRHCIFDQNGQQATLITGGNSVDVIDCEIYDSTGGSGQTNYVIDMGTRAGIVNRCNIHDLNSNGVQSNNGFLILTDCIISNVKGTEAAVKVLSSEQTVHGIISHNTISGGNGHGVYYTSAQALANCPCFNNIIANHNAGGKVGLTVSINNTTANDDLKEFIDWNSFYNNTTNVSVVSMGAGSTILSVDPFVDASTRNFALNSILTFANSFPDLPFLESGGGASVESYTDPGGVAARRAWPQPTILTGF